MAEEIKDPEAGTLVQRIHELEHEQEAAKARIEKLTQAKLSVEIALAHLRTQHQKTAHERANHQRLQAELTSLLQRREQEQDQLKQKIEELRIRTKHEIALLKAERDAALSLVEQQREESEGFGLHQNTANKWLEYVAVSILTGIVLFIILILIQ